MKSKVRFLLLLLVGFHSLSFAQWQFIKGDTYTPQLPKYGIINQPNIYNWPGTKSGAVTWTYNGSLYLFGGSGTDINNTYNDIWKYDASSGMWVWIKGSNTTNSTGVPGVIGVESGACLPAARASCNHWIVGNNLYIFSGDWWKYNFVTNNWTYLGGIFNDPNAVLTYGQLGVAAASNNPLPRPGGSCWAQGNSLYLFGGILNSEVRNDLWKYDLTTNLWTWIKGSNTLSSWYNGVDGTIGIEDAANTPGVKSGAVTVTVGNMVYLYGGYTGLVNYAGDLWRYNMVTNNWTKLNGDVAASLPNFGIWNTFGASTKPGALDGASLWTNGGSIFLFGGIYQDGGSTHNYYNTIWEFDTSSLQWRWVKGVNTPNPKGIYNYKNVTTATNYPGGRSAQISWDLGDNIYIQGGNGTAGAGFGLLADFWKYNKTTTDWTWIGGSDNHAFNTAGYTQNAFTDVSYQTGIANINNRPGAGSYACRWNLNDDTYIFGKTFSAMASFYYTLASSDALWKYSNTNNNWTLIRPITTDTSEIPTIYGTLNVADSLNTPGTRAGEASWIYNNKLYLFGGQSNAYYTMSGDYADSLMNDIWEFDLSTRKWRWIKGSSTCSKNGVYGTLGIAAAANSPGGRTNAQFWQANDKFYLMGGRGKGETGTGIGMLNDLWEYDPVTNNWRWLKGSKLINQSGTYGTKGIANTANTPCGRMNGVCWATSSKLYTFVGRGIEPGNSFADPQLLNELWAYDIAANNWTWLKGSNSPYDYTVENYANYGTKGVAAASVRPYVSDGATGSVVGNKFYLYGGTTNYELSGCTNCLGADNDLWEYDPATNFWKWVEGGGTNPVSTSYPDTPVAPAVIWPGEINNSVGCLSWGYNNRFYIFGGTYYNSNNEIWGYNLCTNPVICNSLPPQVNLGNDTVICVGNTKELNAGNYGSSYLWNTGDTTQSIAVTQSGTYSVHVTNPANLSSDDTVTVTFAAMPTVPFAGSVILCEGSSYTLNALNPGCIFIWNTNEISQSISVDTTGTYSVYIANSSGCELTASINVLQVPKPDAYLGPDAGECSTSPGWPQHAIYPTYVAGDHYLWSTGDTVETIFVTQSGSYSLQITNQNGCVDADTVLITYDTPIVFSLGNDTAICSSIPLTLNIAHPNCTYIWGDGDTSAVRSVNQAGNYLAYINTPFGCQSSDDIKITLLNEPAASAIQAQINGSTVNFSVVNPQNVIGYNWLFGDNTTAGGAAATHTYSQAGTYNVHLIISNICGTDTLLKSIQIAAPPTAINELSDGSGIDVYPNPATQYLNIISNTIILQNVVLVNVLGQEVYNSKDIKVLNYNVNLKDLNSGIYQLNILTPAGTYSKKIVISK